MVLSCFAKNETWVIALVAVAAKFWRSDLFPVSVALNVPVCAVLFVTFQSSPLEND